MKTLSLYFQIHQPFRLRKYRFFDIGTNHYYYDDFQNKNIIQKVAESCYLPANQTLLEMIERYGEDFKVNFSISGPALDQLEMYMPEVIESFQALAKTGQVEFLNETSAHSLTSVKQEKEFIRQVNEHAERIQSLFWHTPAVFNNTEMIYSDRIGDMIAQLGYKAVITEGAGHVLGWKSPQYVYYNALNPKLKILLRNHGLSDDIGLRFSDRMWAAWPLTTEKYVSWLNGLDKQEQLVNIFLSYETFGEHNKADTGIFEFLKALPHTLKQHSDYKLMTASEAVETHPPKAALHVPNAISWADEEKDLTAWLGNELQDEAFEKLYALKPLIDQIDDSALRSDWQHLQISDHFYYMCTKFFSDGGMHLHFNPFESPYDAFINYMNVLSDFEMRVKNALPAEATSTPKETAKAPANGSAAKTTAKKSTGTSKKRSKKTTSE